jgi:glycerol-3-phosphate dehydrogenase
LGLTASKIVKWWDRSVDLKTYLSHPLRFKEELNLKGHSMFLELAPQLNAKINRCGRIMVAKDEQDMDTLKTIQQVTEARGYKDLEFLDQTGLQEKEPAIDSKFIGGIYDPNEFSVFPTEWAIAFAENAQQNSSHILLETEVRNIEEVKDYFVLQTNRGKIKSQFVINAAGLFSDEIAKMIEPIDWSFILWKSEMLIIENKDYLKHIVSEVLVPQKPRIVIPTPEGNIEVGVIMSKSENKLDVSNSRSGLTEMSDYAEYYIPRASTKKDMVKYFVGYMHFNSRNPDDYLIEWPRKRFLNLIACAPGIGPAPAVAADVTKMLKERGLELIEKKDFNPYRNKEPRFIELSTDAKNEKILKDPAYGHIICRCEKTSEREIRDAIRNGARNLDEIKFKTWTGMGRCQGGFCTSRVLQIMSEELSVSPLALRQKGGDSYILKSTTKK